MGLFQSVEVHWQGPQFQAYVQQRAMRTLESYGNNIVVPAIQAQLYPDHGYVTGELSDSMESTPAVMSGDTAVIHVGSEADYTYYVDQGQRSFDGYQMIETAVNQTQLQFAALLKVNAVV